MRTVIQPQLKFGETDIADIVIDPKSRDDIPQILRSLQHIYTEVSLREQVFASSGRGDARASGRERQSEQSNRAARHGAMENTGVGRAALGAGADYDRIQELANQHKTIRQMLGHSD